MRDSCWIGDLSFLLIFVFSSIRVPLFRISTFVRFFYMGKHRAAISLALLYTGSPARETVASIEHSQIITTFLTSLKTSSSHQVSHNRIVEGKKISKKKNYFYRAKANSPVKMAAPLTNLCTAAPV